jgi:hypothetical protein
MRCLALLSLFGCGDAAVSDRPRRDLEPEPVAVVAATAPRGSTAPAAPRLPIVEPPEPEATAAIYGRAIDNVGVVAGVLVEARIGDEVIANTVSDEDGFYELAVAPGIYDLAFHRDDEVIENHGVVVADRVGVWQNLTPEPEVYDGPVIQPHSGVTIDTSYVKTISVSRHFEDTNGVGFTGSSTIEHHCGVDQNNRFEIGEISTAGLVFGTVKGEHDFLDEVEVIANGDHEVATGPVYFSSHGTNSNVYVVDGVEVTE